MYPYRERYVIELLIKEEDQDGGTECGKDINNYSPALRLAAPASQPET